MKTMIFTIGVTNITEECACDFDCKETYERYYSEEEAITAAVNVAKALADDESVYNVSIFGGEYQDDKGNTLGEPYDIYTISNKDRKTTTSARLDNGYVKVGVDAYISNGEIEVWGKKFKL